MNEVLKGFMLKFVMLLYERFVSCSNKIIIASLTSSEFCPKCTLNKSVW